MGRSRASTPRTRLGELERARRILEGDESTFTALVEQLHGRLLRLTLLFVSTKAVAEEVVQETWVAVLDGLPSFEGRSSLSSWIYRICVNRAKTRGMRESRTIPFSALGSSDDEEMSVDADRLAARDSSSALSRQWSDETPERLLMDRQAVGALGEALKGLPANQRAVVTLRDIEGFDSDEVCELLQISEVNQRVLLHRARARLRRVLAGYVAGRS